MSVLKEVTPSGTVGKQVYPAGSTTFCGAVLTAAASAATLVVREGNASGDVILTMKAGVNSTVTTPNDICQKVLRGLHVKVTPANALAYLLIC